MCFWSWAKPRSQTGSHLSVFGPVGIFRERCLGERSFLPAINLGQFFDQASSFAAGRHLRQRGLDDAAAARELPLSHPAVDFLERVPFQCYRDLCRSSV